MGPIRSIIIEGVDRLGKDTLIKNLLNQLGYFQVVHYQKPELLHKYQADMLERMPNAPPETHKQGALRAYQQESFKNMFSMLASPGRFILNRAHLGEMVYAPRYRKYDGSYVLDLEENDSLVGDALDTTLLILLHTSSFAFIRDDGESFDFDAKEAEQLDFTRAFERSLFRHKLMVDVHDGRGDFVPSSVISSGVIHAYERIQQQQNTMWQMGWQRNEDSSFERKNVLLPHPRLAVSFTVS